MILVTLGQQEPQKRYCVTECFILQGLGKIYTSLFCHLPTVCLCMPCPPHRASASWLYSGDCNSAAVAVRTA